MASDFKFTKLQLATDLGGTAMGTLTTALFVSMPHPSTQWELSSFVAMTKWPRPGWVPHRLSPLGWELEPQDKRIIGQ